MYNAHAKRPQKKTTVKDLTKMHQNNIENQLHYIHANSSNQIEEQASDSIKCIILTIKSLSAAV